eukprot:gene18565-biopygen19154
MVLNYDGRARHLIKSSSTCVVGGFRCALSYVGQTSGVLLHTAGAEERRKVSAHTGLRLLRWRVGRRVEALSVQAMQFLEERARRRQYDSDLWFPQRVLSLQKSARGFWPDKLRHCHITDLELEAVYTAVKAFLREPGGEVV